MSDAWDRVAATDPDALRDATLELHWAVQVVAAAGQTFVEERDDDSHRAMRWHAGLRVLVGAPFAGVYPFRVGVRPEDLTVVLLDGSDGTLGALPLAGRTLDEGHEWLSLGMATYLGGPPPRIRRPQYDMPEHPVAHGGRFSTGGTEERRALAWLFGASAGVLEEVRAERPNASEVTCWPHHLDIATLITLGVGDSGAPTKTVGAGMAPLGGGFDRWYWYVTPWPAPNASRLVAWEGPGRWHTDSWTGAVLEAGSLDAAPGGIDRERIVREFLDAAIPAATATLEGGPGTS